MFTRLSRYAVPVFALALIAAVAASACGGDDGEAPPNGALAALAKSPFRGGMVEPPYDKPGVVLTDTTGKPFDLRKETEGYITLFYMGYTHCPDICPTHMHDIAKVLKESDPAVGAKIKTVFVTADPERDTPQVLGDWIHFFNPEFIGLVYSSFTTPMRKLHSSVMPIHYRQGLMPLLKLPNIFARSFQ